jgi:hypothetical protein
MLNFQTKYFSYIRDSLNQGYWRDNTVRTNCLSKIELSNLVKLMHLQDKNNIESSGLQVFESCSCSSSQELWCLSWIECAIKKPAENMPVERKLDNVRALSIASMQEFKAMDQAIWQGVFKVLDIYKLLAPRIEYQFGSNFQQLMCYKKEFLSSWIFPTINQCPAKQLQVTSVVSTRSWCNRWEEREMEIAEGKEGGGGKSNRKQKS